MILTYPARRSIKADPPVSATVAAEPYAAVTDPVRVPVWTPSVADVRCWNHGTVLAHLFNRLWLFFGSAPRDEGAAGCVVLATYSDDEGLSWAQPIEALSAWEPVDLTHTLPATQAACDRLLQIPDGRWFVIYGVFHIDNLTDEYEQLGVLAQQIDGLTFGEPQWVLGGPDARFDRAPRSVAAEVVAGLCARGSRGTASLAMAGKWPHSPHEYVANGPPCVIETATLPLAAGGWIRYGRWFRANEEWLAVQTSGNGADWTRAAVTSIPNSSQVVSLVHSSNRRLLVWNKAYARNPLLLGISVDGSAWNPVRIVREVPAQETTPVFAGRYKEGGPSYPSLCELPSGRVACAYSIAKERIEVTTFSLPP